MTKGSAVAKRRNSRSSPTSIVNINREGISPQEVCSNKENNRGGRGGKGGGSMSKRTTPRSRHVFFAPDTSTTTGIVTPQPSTFTHNNKTQLINQFRISPISSSSSPWYVPSSIAATTTPQDQQQQPNFIQNGMTTRRKSKSTSSSKTNSNSHKKSSSSHKRWKQLLFKRLRAKDSRILHFLQSRPPPPTVGPAVHMMDVCDNDEEVGSNGAGRCEYDYDYFGQNNDDNTSIPESYMHFFNQLGGESSRNRSGSTGSSSSSNQSDVEKIDDEEKSMPITSSSHSHTFGNSGNGNGGGDVDCSLDLYGSYLQQDYQQSDYSNSNLFDENMFVTC